ncbi:MAG: HAMP domain-containing protein [Candidatus Omnitrophica bacterium]|nr:HAMP domain-containing protein [Candidatus Omnitrophota bacterium]
MKVWLWLRQKLIFIILTSILLSISIAEYLNLKDFIAAYKEVIEKRVFAEATVLRYLVEDTIDLGLSLGELKGLSKDCQEVIDSIPYGKYCFIMDSEGKAHHHNLVEKKGFIYTDSITRKALDAGEEVVQYYQLDSGERIYDFSMSLKDSTGKQIGLIRIGVLSKIIDKEVVKLIKNALWTGGIVVILAFIITLLLLQRAILWPIKQLMSAVVKVGKGNLDAKIVLKTRDEFEELAEVFNKMTENLKKITVSRDEFIKEVTERKKAQQELSQAREATLNIMEDLQESYNKLKQTQAQFIQAEKMSALGVLASGVAHEVKNPLGIIIQAANYLEGIMSGEQRDIKDIVKIVEMIKESVRRADNIVRSLLDYSRVSALVLKPEDINTILKNSINLVKHRREFEYIEIIDETKQGISKVSVDKNRVQQVFINLLVNALHAMPKGGKIIIRSFDTKLDEIQAKVGRRALDSFMLGERVVKVEIEDTGVGISQENLGKIFDPFFSTKGSRKGAGLGLSVCANIIDLHKGLIDVESQEGKGTKITITFKITEGR